MQHAWERRGMHGGALVGEPQENTRNNLDVDGRIIIKLISKKYDRRVCTGFLGRYRDKWGSLLKTVMKFRNA
jgi:hypothetical protein